MHIASASTTVKFHEFPSGTVKYNYQPGTNVAGPIRSISWSKDGNWLALVPHSGQVEIVSVKDQLKLIHTIQAVKQPLCAAFQNTTKKNIGIGTSDGSILIYDIKARNVKKHYSKSTSAITHIDFTAKDSHLVAACAEGSAFIYSNVSNNLAGTMKVPRSESISALRTNPIKRNYVAAGSNEGVVAVWDINTNKNKFFVGSHKAPVSAVTFSPISSDLVVSTGLDRQFCLYDISANKCIGNIFVENNMTAVDVSPDGKFIAMASQNGDIHVYDIKKIQQPMHTFAAHNSAIKHLSFRKSEKDYDISCDSSNFDIPNEGSPPDQKPLSSAVAANNNDSFNFFLSQSVIGDATAASCEPADSFIMAVGLNTTEPALPLAATSSMRQEANNVINSTTPINPTKVLISDKLHNKTQEALKARFTSTPNNLDPNTPLSSTAQIDRLPSPIAIASNVEKMIKDIIQSEMKITGDELKNEIKYHATHTMTQTRQLFLDLVMQNVKESIKIENQFNNLRNDLLPSEPNQRNTQNDYLIEENFRLKQKIASLEEELETLKNNNKNIVE